jgi:RNA polymerase sigma factor (sigma-70 family)
VTEVARKAERCRHSGDAGLLEEAFARYQHELVGTLFYLVGNLEDARDALQETFLKCWRHRDEVAEVQNLKAWIFRIALNTGRDLRQTAWRRKRQPLPEDANMLASHQDGPLEVVERRERLELVRNALRELRGVDQEVFLLRQNGGMTYEEIAEAVGIPLGTVKTRMRMALTRLRQVLAET